MPAKKETKESGAKKESAPKQNASLAVKAGDKIKVDYVGTLTDGSEFDNSQKHGAPLEFTVGEGEVIKGFDEAVIGMKKGEEKTVTIQPTDAYGEKMEHLIIKIPKDKLPQDSPLKKGMVFAVGLPTGQQMPAVVVDLDDKEVQMDFNHPLAGESLTFKFTIIDIL